MKTTNLFKKQIETIEANAKQCFDELAEAKTMQYAVKLNTALGSAYKYEHPFVETKTTKKNGTFETTYRSEIPVISNWIFETQAEVVLANAIYENMPVFEPNEFTNIFKFTLRLMNVKSRWAE